MKTINPSIKAKYRSELVTPKIQNLLEISQLVMFQNQKLFMLF